MIPEFISLIGSPWPLLPPGIHDSTLEEVYERYVLNAQRKAQFEGMVKALENLFGSGCPQVFLDGSYVTGKPTPNDYEVCWDMRFVNPTSLDPVFFDFSNGRSQQKKKYFGEFFPAAIKEGFSGRPFLEFFQIDKSTGKPKGIVRLLNHLTKGGSL
ncbi:MAG: hypothetical protein JNM88_21075 [Chitinophagaceae bacterium]|nr:hypothetical protein [Chitinophagaceae bacterium]